MFKGLQNYAGPDRETSTSVRSTEIILNDQFVKKVLSFLNDATSEIRVCAYAWRWYDGEPELEIQRLNVELLKAMRRGVTVRVLVDTMLMEARLKELGFNAKSTEITRMLHMKAISVDEKTIILGSHNLTKRATRDNYELSVAIQEFETVVQFNEWFDAMWRARG